MIPKPPPEPISTKSSLTLECLSSVPKRSMDDFLLTYHREQRRFRELYASYGRAEVKSWDISNGDSSHSSHLSAVSVPQKSADFMFGTPVLKPRVPPKAKGVLATHVEMTKGPRREHTDQSQAEQEGGKSLCPKNPRILQPNTLHCPVSILDKTLPDVKPGKTLKLRKRQPRGDSDMDEEKENRLAERRERKKTKKDIIKQLPTTDTEQEPQKRQKKQTKAQTSFALMHGFSATNIGKNRLTLDTLVPRQSTGVFQKGKASNAMKVVGVDGKKQQHVTSFSESQFLRKKQDNTKHTTKHTTHSESPSASSSPKITSNKRLPRTVQSSQQQSEPDMPQESQPRNPRPPYNSDDSIVWDAEIASTLPSSDDSSFQRQGTILISFSKTVDLPQLKVDLTGMDDGTVSTPVQAVETALHDSSISPPISVRSLGPSQSASQVRSKASQPCHTSGYFNAAVLSETPLLPTDCPLVKEPIGPHELVDEYLSHSRPGLDSPSGFAAAQESAISMHDHDAMAIDVSHASIFVLPNAVASPQECGFYPEPSYWSEVDWNGCYDEYLSSNIDIPIISPVASEYYLDPEFGMTGLKSGPGSEDESFRWYSAVSDHLRNPSVGYDNSSRCLSPSCVGGSYYPFIAGTVAGTDSVRDASRLDTLPRLPYEAFNTLDGVDLESIVAGEQRASFLEASSTNSAFQEESDDMEADNYNFYQGRALLYGLNPTSSFDLLSNRLVGVEAEVAGLLKQNHWLPQKL